MAPLVLVREELDTMLRTLSEDGYEVMGPTIADNAIVYDRVASTADLPEGWTDVQEGGTYRLERRDDDALFGYNLGPTSWKQFLFPSRSQLFRVRRENGSLVFEEADHTVGKRAFLGVRACELAAIAIQDTVFTGSGHVDKTYTDRRGGFFVIAVNCSQAASTCFCESMGTGPECTAGFDLVITEMNTDRGFEYLVESGTARGADLLASIEGRTAETRDRESAAAVVESARAEMGREMATEGIRDLLVENADHPQWADVATRCLTCGNCTLACPTCFCSTTSDTVTLDGDAVRTRRWDSCFDLEFSALHGHPVRHSARSRYRQWMTHKLATWHDQFGSSGCVGCGRCITWCPVGIDITAEIAAMRETVNT